MDTIWNKFCSRVAPHIKCFNVNADYFPKRARQFGYSTSRLPSLVLVINQKTHILSEKYTLFPIFRKIKKDMPISIFTQFLNEILSDNICLPKPKEAEKILKESFSQPVYLMHHQKIRYPPASFYKLTLENQPNINICYSGSKTLMTSLLPDDLASHIPRLCQVIDGITTCIQLSDGVFKDFRQMKELLEDSTLFNRVRKIVDPRSMFTQIGQSKFILILVTSVEPSTKINTVGKSLEVDDLPISYLVSSEFEHSSGLMKTFDEITGSKNILPIEGPFQHAYIVDSTNLRIYPYDDRRFSPFHKWVVDVITSPQKFGRVEGSREGLIPIPRNHPSNDASNSANGSFMMKIVTTIAPVVFVVMARNFLVP